MKAQYGPPQHPDTQTQAEPTGVDRTDRSRLEGVRSSQRVYVPPAHAPAGAVWHVQRGDTLWSIAQRLLGRDASDAAIARKVRQLTELNATRLRSGNPDLIMPGEVLRLG